MKSNINGSTFGSIFRYSLVIMLATMGVPKTKLLAQVITLDSVLRMIDDRNPMLRQYDDKIRALDAYAAGARSWMAPMVGVGTFMTPYPGQFIRDESGKGSFMIAVEQNIPNPAKLRANANYLASKSAVERQGRSYQFNNLRAEARSAYFQWLVEEERLKVLVENRQIIDLMIKLAKIRYPYNQGSLGNIYKAEARGQEVENTILMAQGFIAEQQYRLKTLMNLSLETRFSVDTSYRVADDAWEVQPDTAWLSRQRSDVIRIDQTIAVMRLNQQMQRFQAKPDFKVQFNHMQPFGSMPAMFSAMAMISIPIVPWSSRMYKADVSGMQHAIHAMKQEREATLIASAGNLAGTVTQLSTMRQQLKNYAEKIIPALRKNYQTLMLAYEENREQLPIVLDGWEALNMAQMEYLNKKKEYYTMIVGYEKELEK